MHQLVNKLQVVVLRAGTASHFPIAPDSKLCDLFLSASSPNENFIKV